LYKGLAPLQFLSTGEDLGPDLTLSFQTFNLDNAPLQTIKKLSMFSNDENTLNEIKKKYNFFFKKKNKTKIIKK
jgi:hypothetical protein